MWTQTTWHTAVKWIVTLVPVFFILLAVVLSVSLTSEGTDESSEIEPTFVPIDTVPIETVPVETAPVETVPIETVPIEMVPVETVPIESTVQE
jgi:hypothetical protein